jgi:pimeloyl-ACP methyl ester carboxylesterase
MDRVLIFIPGIMGSKLREPAAAGGRPLWHEHVRQAVSQLVRDPSLLKWQPGSGLEPYEVLREVTVPFKKFFKVGICQRLSKELTDMALIEQLFTYREYAYDWRQDITETARQLGEWFDQLGFTRNYKGEQQKEDSPRIALVCHSMGGLVAAIAMKRGYINPENVYRYVTIGSPLAGAPAAFRGLYDLGYLPGMEWMERAINWRWNRITSRRILLESLQSFASSYQLLPPQAEDFVELAGGGTINPLARPVIPLDKRQAAQAAHHLLAGLETFLQKFPGLEYLFIYGDHQSNTDYRFRARENAVDEVYEGVTCRNKTDGDGTVPVDSAALKKRRAHFRHPVAGAAHMSMCNDTRIIQAVKSFLAKP